LADFLEDRISFAAAVNTSCSELVHVLPAGNMTLNPHTVINNGGLKRLLDEVRGAYAYVVLDTPPILLASEALSVAVVADGTLLCAMRDRSREGQVRSAGERLRSVGARVLGAVLSGIPSRQYTARYGNYPYSRSYAT
jgi:Mrp family chromosome partitioning ATPase